MAKKLFVGGLSWNTTEDGLRSAFNRFGAMDEVKVITDRVTGRSRGFGFITFTESENADAAISEMDGKEIDGRVIKVNEANDRKPTRGGSFGRRTDGRRGFGRDRRDDD